MISCIGVASRPPYSFGQFRQAQPFSYFSFCQAFARSEVVAFAFVARLRVVLELRVCVEEVARLGAELAFFGGIVEIHRAVLVWRRGG